MFGGGALADRLGRHKCTWIGQKGTQLCNFNNFIRRRMSDHNKITLAINYIWTSGTILTTAEEPGGK